MKKHQHDLLFKKTFQKPKFFKKFCEIYLPKALQKKIKLKTLRLRRLSTHFVHSHLITGELKETIADIMYSAELVHGGEVLFLFSIEHQSSPDKLYPLRHAHYVTSALRDYERQYKPKALPVPISFLYYHGKVTPYPHTLDIYQLFSDQKLAKQYFLKPTLIDLGYLSDQELLDHKELAGLEIAYKYVHTKKVPIEKIEKLAQGLSQCSYLELRYLWYHYALDAWDAGKQSMLETYEKSIPKDREFVMTAAEQLRQEGWHNGRQEGRQEGQSIGASNKAREIAIELLKANQPIEMIARCVKLPKEEVLKLQEVVSS